MLRGFSWFPWMTLSFIDAEILWRRVEMLQWMEHSSCPHSEEKIWISAFGLRCCHHYCFGPVGTLCIVLGTHDWGSLHIHGVKETREKEVIPAILHLFFPRSNLLHFLLSGADQVFRRHLRSKLSRQQWKIQTREKITLEAHGQARS